MNKNIIRLGGMLVAALAAVGFFRPQAGLAESVYGALYYAANLVAAEDNGFNKESVIMYYPGEDGFIAATTNQPVTGTPGLSEWWVSDKLGTSWERSDDNPLETYGCVQVGRHSVEQYNGDFYFGASCSSQGNNNRAMLFKLTGKNSVELIYTHEPGSSPEVSVGEDVPPIDQPIEEPGQGPGEQVGADSQFPTAAVVNDKLYMFYNGGFVEYDGTTIQDLTTATNQPEGVPLEASGTDNGNIYLAFTSGEVMAFDGSTYTTIGDNYLEEGEVFSGGIPSIDVFNGTVYVGNQASTIGDEEQLEPLGVKATEGAKLFKYDPDDSDADSKIWEVLTTLGSDDSIINKMQPSTVDGSNYLAFFTANGNTGTNIFAVDEKDNIITMVESGLGGEDPANNTEVVSISNRKVTDNDLKKTVLIFGTQNSTDQTKIFVLNIDEDLAFTPLADNVLSAPVEEPVDEELTVKGGGVSAVKKATTAKGEVFKLEVPKSQVQVGDVYTLYVNGKKVYRVKAKTKAALTLKYTGASKLSVGKTFRVKVGRRAAYGKGDGQLVSDNTIVGDTLKVTVKK